MLAPGFQRRGSGAHAFPEAPLWYSTRLTDKKRRPRVLHVTIASDIAFENGPRPPAGTGRDRCDDPPARRDARVPTQS
ncbi:hypothetical protein MSHI_20220 [Mycobacterium shinjukuense]|uniref:Uncharacterized protein n=1 Tax=Mycobacterium shinjukuense TaxID=398694 RepID=A0A7I7MPV6_9MYCO|nr:hypothetical protein MSHI_20220 [Mycobacterium shinjukuense]